MKYNIVLMLGFEHLGNITFNGERKDIPKFVYTYCDKNDIYYTSYSVFAQRGDLKKAGYIERPDGWSNPLTKWFNKLDNDILQERLK